MATPTPTAAARTERGVRALAGVGRWVYALAVFGLGADLAAAAHERMFLFRAGTRPVYPVVPVLPLPPPIPALAYGMAAVLAACGVGLLTKPGRSGFSREWAAMAAAAFLLISALVLELPKYAAFPGDMSVRTVFFEPLAMAALAALLLPRSHLPPWLERTSRGALGLSLIVFGVDHFLGLASIAPLIPTWIPWHVFWTEFFGIVFIATGIGIGLNLWLRWSALGLGLMFAIWVFTLHLPLALRWESLPGRSNGATLWSSLFIAMAIWGGAWALAGRTEGPFS